MPVSGTVSSMITSSFDEPVLYGPARVENDLPCEKLCIITGFMDCERISTHMIFLSEGMKNGRFSKKQCVEILLGMSKSSLSPKKHEDICRLIKFINESRGMPHIQCRYICSGQEVHSKVYIWLKPFSSYVTPTKAFCGSLNYTINAFYKRRESVCLCDPYEAYEYYQSLLADSVDCFDPLVAEKLKNIVNAGRGEMEEIDNSEKEYLEYDKLVPISTINVSLLRSDGSDTGYGSGINWGIRKNGTRRNKNQAYIPYNRNDRVIGFFPDRIKPDDANCPMFKVITKDFGSFHMRMAQQGNKALHSVESNAILGEWIRKKLDVSTGGYITKQMLENYGKTYVTFRKYKDKDDNDIYLLDF